MPTIKDIAPESVFTIELNAGTQGRQGPKGEPGIQGIQGPKGETGPKPIRGIDYFTQQDISNMVSTITDNSNSAFNENVSVKTKEFNNNASAKTSSFDNNAVLKTEEFNTNANSKITDFNLNVNNKTTEFNTNSSTKTTAFNNNATDKQKAYNDNAEASLKAYNDNSNAKLKEYDDNATLKVEEYNSNADSKKEELNQITSDFGKQVEENTNDITILETYLDNLTPKSSAKGELVHITDALNLPTFENKVDGNVEQETTKGINKLDTSKLTTTKINGVDVTVNKDGSITFNGTMEKTIWLELSNKDFNLPSGEYTWSLRPSYVLPSGDYTIGIRNKNNVVITAAEFYQDIENVTLNEDLSNGFVAIYIGTLTTFNNFTIYPMLVEGTYTKDTIPPFEKFTNGASPNPEYPQEIEVLEGDLSYKVNSKNFLISKPYTHISNGITTDFDGKKFKIKGTSTSNWAFLSKEFPLHLQPGKYTISKYKATSFQFVINLWNEKVKFRSIYLGKTATKITFEIKEKAKKATLSFDSVEPGTVIDEECEFQLELGEASTKFEIPQEQLVPLDLKGNWVGKINDNIKDYLVTDKKKYWLVKNVDKVVLNGSESGWNYAETYKYFRSSTYDFGDKKPKAWSKTMKQICNRFLMNSTWSGANSFRDNVDVDGEFYPLQDNGYMLAFRNLAFNNVDDFKQWLNENNVIVYYELATPYIIELGELPEPIKTFEGVNNIQLLANLDTNIEVKYALDVKKYYDNKLAEISAQII